MRIVLIMAAMIGLTGCVSGPSGDVANYDNLKVARAACTAKGEDLVLTKDGDPERLSAYECKGK